MWYTFDERLGEKHKFKGFEIRKRDFGDITPATKLTVYTSSKTMLFKVLNEMNRDAYDSKYWYEDKS